MYLLVLIVRLSDAIALIKKSSRALLLIKASNNLKNIKIISRMIKDVAISLALETFKNTIAINSKMLISKNNNDKETIYLPTLAI